MATPFDADQTIKEDNFINESERNSGDPTQDEGKLVQLESDGKFSSLFLPDHKIVTFNSSGTWTKKTGLVLLRVQVWGAGGGGSTAFEGCAAGGGGYSEKWFQASELGSTETVTIGAGGVQGGVGANGGNSSFGSLLTAYGGEGGVGTGRGGSSGGPTKAGQDVSETTQLNILGTASGPGGAGTFGAAGGAHEEDGGDAYWGGAGGAGGGGGAPGSSVHGGDGGSSGSNGSQPAGGGGVFGDGGDGRIVLTEFY